MSGAQLDPLRLRAGQLLVRWRNGTAHLEDLLERSEAEDRLHSREMAADARRRLRELLFGSMHLLGRYEHAIALRSRRGGKLADAPWAALVLGLHELFAMRTPDHAAVGQAVLLCRRLGGEHASGFVNGVLRATQREGLERGFPRAEDDPLGHASLWLSHPRWMVERWQQRLGSAEMLALCAANNARRPLVVRCLPGRRDALSAAFTACAWEHEPSALAPDALRLAPGVPASLVLAEFGHELVVQDEAAQCIAPLVAAERPQFVVDLCAAPGAKALQLRALLPNAQIVAADRSLLRLRRLRENQRRLDASLHLLAQDGSAPALPAGCADAVLLDAPCSGSGVLARRHDARWRRSPEQLRELCALQAALADAATTLLRPGGILVYATCALEPEENELQVEALLGRRGELEEVGVEGLVDARAIEDGRLCLWPQRHGCDGAFAARLRRRG